MAFGAGPGNSGRWDRPVQGVSPRSIKTADAATSSPRGIDSSGASASRNWGSAPTSRPREGNPNASPGRVGIKRKQAVTVTAMDTWINAEDTARWPGPREGRREAHEEDQERAHSHDPPSQAVSQEAPHDLAGCGTEDDGHRSWPRLAQDPAHQRADHHRSQQRRDTQGHRGRASRADADSLGKLEEPPHPAHQDSRHQQQRDQRGSVKIAPSPDGHPKPHAEGTRSHHHARQGSPSPHRGATPVRRPPRGRGHSPGPSGRLHPGDTTGSPGRQSQPARTRPRPRPSTVPGDPREGQAEAGWQTQGRCRAGTGWSVPRRSRHEH